MNNIGVHNVNNINAMLDSHAIWPFTHVVRLPMQFPIHSMILTEQRVEPAGCHRGVDEGAGELVDGCCKARN